MKNRFSLWFLILLSFSFAIFFSCASTSEEEQNDIVPIVEPQEIPENIDSPVVDAESEISAETTTETEQKTELVGTLLPEIKQKTTYFEFEDSSIMEYAKIGSPSAIKTAISKIKNPAEKYTEEETDKILELGATAVENWKKELEEMDPRMRAAVEKDYQLHPEKIPACATKQNNWRLYKYNSLNKTDKGTELEIVSPEILSKKILGKDYMFINPKNGALLDWVNPDHDCAIYTQLEITQGTLVRTKDEDFVKGQVRTTGR